MSITPSPRRALLAVIGLVAGACSSTSGEPIERTSMAMLAAVEPAASITVPFAEDGSAPFEWPTVGWSRLEVRTTAEVDATTRVHIEAIVTAAWTPDEVRLVTSSGRAGRPESWVEEHTTARGADATAIVAGVQGVFEASRREDLDRAAPGPDGGTRYTGTFVDASGLTIEQVWEVGRGSPPWATR